MKRSFYEFLMTKRDANNHEEIAQFANNAFFDQSFPKHTGNQQALSEYLELTAGYLPEMTIFDNAYQLYLESEMS